MSGAPASFVNRLSKLSTLALLLALIGVQPAQAALFDDQEARQQVKDLTTQTSERFDTLSKAQFDLVSQIQALREENAKLRGSIETLNYELESSKKRQQDFYIDLDNRLRKLETSPQSTEAATVDGEQPAGAADPALEPMSIARPAGDPAAETREYEAALNAFKANKIKDAAAAFEAFVKAHPDSALAPNAQYWLGNAHYALRDCKRAIEDHKVVISRWAQHAKAPDALVNIATCQQELGDAKAAKASLETVLIKYPDSSAAATAKQRLKK